MNSPLTSPVSVLRWPSGGDADGVFEMFRAQEDGENVLLALKLAGRPPASIAGTVPTVPSPAPAPFHGAVLKGCAVEVTVPARSVVVLTAHQPWEWTCESV